MASTMMDRFVRWNLDFDGDLYGDDERERTRWYEGIATASQLQSILVPWVAVALVWILGRPAVLPLAVVLAALLAPMAFTSIYVSARRVEVTPRAWSAKRKLLGVLAGAPYAVFIISASYRMAWPQEDSWISIIIGAVIGAAIGAVFQAYATRKRNRAEAAVFADED
ncbi:hypothetical protein [Actinoplanes rectilineatus]|uniref:hypothetical protein n=1 Tax=Actinoplanes rectilineatus TaxID=113571 RepID=UPI0005F2B778|nr:hypothetical protein [Actinoplanes rectilineatus]